MNSEFLGKLSASLFPHTHPLPKSTAGQITAAGKHIQFILKLLAQKQFSFHEVFFSDQLRELASIRMNCLGPYGR